VTDGMRFCAACGVPVSADAAAVIAAKMRRQHKEMRLLVVGAGLVLAVAVWVSVLSSRRISGGSRVSGATAAAPQAVPALPSAAQNSPDQPTSPSTSGSQLQPPPQASDSSTSTPASNTPAGGIDLETVQKALAQLTQHGGAGNTPAPPPARSGSDRYPGSQPVNVADANIPDIGIPVTREVYSTTDPVSAVIRYYRQRYPDATLTEINGQQILAVDRAGASKVIAIGSTGQETRIAIVQPGT
jgi:cytoskeletal protein RodZ